MSSASESLSPWRSALRQAAEGNCVAVRRGGEQPEADSQSTTQVNPFRPTIPASLLANGEACGGQESVGLSRSHHASRDEDRGIEGGWGWNERKGSWLTTETRDPEDGLLTGQGSGSQSAHSSSETANSRGAKERRKVNA